MKAIMVEAIDTIFIMGLCFATLLLAMLMQGNVIAGIVYKIKEPSFAITISALVIYLTFVIAGSNKGLKKIIDQIYSGQAANHTPLEVEEL